MITAQDVETIDEGELLSLCQTNSTTINSESATVWGSGGGGGGGGGVCCGETG